MDFNGQRKAFDRAMRGDANPASIRRSMPHWLRMGLVAAVGCLLAYIGAKSAACFVAAAAVCILSIYWGMIAGTLYGLEVSTRWATATITAYTLNEVARLGKEVDAQLLHDVYADVLEERASPLVNSRVRIAQTRVDGELWSVTLHPGDLLTVWKGEDLDAVSAGEIDIVAKINGGGRRILRIRTSHRLPATVTAALVAALNGPPSRFLLLRCEPAPAELVEAPAETPKPPEAE